MRLALSKLFLGKQPRQNLCGAIFILVGFHIYKFTNQSDWFFYCIEQQLSRLLYVEFLFSLERNFYAKCNRTFMSLSKGVLFTPCENILQNARELLIVQPFLIVYLPNCRIIKLKLLLGACKFVFGNILRTLL